MRRVHLMNEFKRLFSIKSDQAENEEIKQRIDEASAISGTNLWILIMAIFIASIGLNVNSTAVIIGAMLISPLMGGIISIGYGFAMDDVEHIKRSLTNFGIQVFILTQPADTMFRLAGTGKFVVFAMEQAHPRRYAMHQQCLKHLHCVSHPAAIILIRLDKQGRCLGTIGVSKR